MGAAEYAQDPLEIVAQRQFLAGIRGVLASLGPRERKVLELRFGLEDGRGRTLEEVGREFNVTRERIRQIEAKALRKLRHPTQVRVLKEWLTGEVAPELWGVTPTPIFGIIQQAVELLNAAAQLPMPPPERIYLQPDPAVVTKAVETAIGQRRTVDCAICMGKLTPVTLQEALFRMFGYCRKCGSNGFNWTISPEGLVTCSRCGTSYLAML